MNTEDADFGAGVTPARIRGGTTARFVDRLQIAMACGGPGTTVAASDSRRQRATVFDKGRR